MDNEEKIIWEVLSIEGWTLDELNAISLKSICKHLDISSTGTKQVLIKRIQKCVN